MVEKLIDKYSIGPDISFRSVDVMNEAFRGHIDRASYGDIPKILFGFNSKPKISNFELTIPNKDIANFNISMYNT